MPVYEIATRPMGDRDDIRLAVFRHEKGINDFWVNLGLCIYNMSTKKGAWFGELGWIRRKRGLNLGLKIRSHLISPVRGRAGWMSSFFPGLPRRTEHVIALTIWKDLEMSAEVSQRGTVDRDDRTPMTHCLSLWYFRARIVNVLGAN